jgi:hypothetical protein
VRTLSGTARAKVLSLQASSVGERGLQAGRERWARKLSVLRRVVTGAFAIMLAFTLMGDPAVADTLSRDDPRDTLGRLDIRRVRHGHAGSDEVTHTISTYRRFGSRSLQGRTHFIIDMFLNDGDDERFIVIFWRNGSLRAPVFRGDLTRAGTARVTRPNRRSVKVTVREMILGDPSKYAWVALLISHRGAQCSGEEGCHDLAPNHREILHELA